MTRIGQIKKLVRYPIKSMAGVEMDQSTLGWHGLAGDRRFAVREIGRAGDFPWLTASRIPELLRYRATEFESLESLNQGLSPTHVRNPSGELLDVLGDGLRSEIERLAKCPVELMALKHGIFDEAVISLIAMTTVSHVCTEAGVPNDSRRFRANIEVSIDPAYPFAEDDWVGRVIRFGEPADAPAIYVSKRDERCKMIGLDPDTGEHNPSVLKTAVRLNDNHSGVYGTVIRTGALQIGDALYLTTYREPEAAP